MTISPLRCVASVVACALASVVTAAERPAAKKSPEVPDVVPSTPSDHVPVGLFATAGDLEVTLWAKSPMLRNPTNIDIDAKGRIWVAESYNYRTHIGRDPAGDRIVVLEDTDGDGRADKSTVFVQERNLVSPMGIAVIDNKIVVSQPPDLLVYTDVDRDLKFNPRVDKREVLLTGFNGRNHDHGLHSVTVGPDGRWYFSQGNVGALITDRSGRTFRIGGAYDASNSYGSLEGKMFSWASRDIAGAVSDDGHVYVGGFTMRMEPDGTHATVVGHNYRNSYEQAVSSFGDMFTNHNDDPPACGVFFTMEAGNLGYYSDDGQKHWRGDRRPGQSVPVAEWRQEDPGHNPATDIYGRGAGTGMVSYESDVFGPKWRGVLLSADALINKVFGYRMQPDGAGYRPERFDFLTSEDKSGSVADRSDRAAALRVLFRPSDVAVGPDGAIYVADWFDQRSGGHADADTVGYGAIYRIAPKGFKSVIPAVNAQTLDGQIAMLKSAAINVRAVGHELLRARGAEAAGAVAKLLTDENPYIRARAIWLLARLGPKGVAAVEGQLESGDATTRMVAFRALRRENIDVVGHAKRLVNDPAPVVRREVALAMRDDVPVTQAKEILLAVARGYDGKDRYYLEAWGTGCSGKEAEIDAALAAAAPSGSPETWPNSYVGLRWRLKQPQSIALFAARAKSVQLAEKDRLDALTVLGYQPQQAAVDALLEVAASASGRVKDTALWWLINYGDTRWESFDVRTALKKRGLYDADSATIQESIVPRQPTPSKLPPVREIARLTGDVQRGAARAAACYMCHRIGESGVDYGPTLNGFARRQSTEEVINAIINPSADISHGYEGTEVITTDDKTVHGMEESGGKAIRIRSMGGNVQVIPSTRVKTRGDLKRSLMLSAEQLGLSAQDVADIVAYLKTL